MLRWFLLAMIILWILWVITGGPQSATRKDQFIEQPQPIESGTTYDVNDLKSRR